MDCTYPEPRMPSPYTVYILRKPICYFVIWVNYPFNGEGVAFTIAGPQVPVRATKLIIIFRSYHALFAPFQA